MADTLFNAVLETVRLVGNLRFGLATSGSTSQIVDTNSTMRPEDNDYFNAGIAFIISNADSPGAAPEGQFARISDYTYSGGTIDIATHPAFTAAVASGDRYGLSVGRFSLDDVINAVNVALTGIYVPIVNSTALDTADNKTEYTLPAGIDGSNLQSVHYQIITDDSDDNQWHEIRNWKIIQYASTTQDVLVLPQLTSGRDLRLDYITTHSPMYSSSSPISKHVHLDRIKYRAAEHLYSSEIAWEDNFKHAASMSNYYANKADEAEARHPISLPPRNGIVITYDDDDSSYTGTVGKVRL